MSTAPRNQRSVLDMDREITELRRERKNLVSENASLKAEVARLKKAVKLWRDVAEEHCEYNDCSMLAEKDREIEALNEFKKMFVQYHDAFTASQQRVKELEKALEKARDAIAQAPEDAFGDIPDTPDRQGWWIRDELVDSFNKALSDTERGT